ncbi:polysaccharide pyruvyl transferase family protein [Pedobacter panaciterrae]|uniref:polysaccharide pyruvyl transferase family protein n=1 Tax=Pedobacter panaciterrae TaxID=363849 RepID=UPI00259A133A|nr:polysaccharide pyruvyl transferase family protein [uncultured Pedobacter sp.]
MNVFVKLFAELNLGDDLFLKILLTRYPKANFVLNAKKNYEDVFDDCQNLTVYQDVYTQKSRKFFYRLSSVIERNLLPKMYKSRLKRNIEAQFLPRFENTDVFVSIGGSIFMQPKKLPAYADVEYYNLVNKCFDKIFYIGCNFGPYDDGNYKKSYEDIFKKATDVCFREKASWKMFSDLENVRVRPDVVFGLDFPKKEKVEKTVGFSIVSARNNINKKKYIEKYVELIQFYQNKNYKVYLFSFCKKQDDESTINSIVDLLDNKTNIKKVFYSGDINSFLRLYSSVKKMYCGRFHAMILSMLFDQEFYPIAYSKKMSNVLEDIDYKGDIINIEEFHLINPEELDNKISSNIYDIKEQIIKSKEQFEKLDVVLNNGNI